MFQKGKKNPHSGGLNIMIVGCGKVGMTLVDRLSKEGHDISVVDKNAARLQSVTHMHDVYGVVGNGASFTVLKEAGIENTDILISVTDSDELNLLCCLVAKRSGHCEVIARVRTPESISEGKTRTGHDDQSGAGSCKCNFPYFIYADGIGGSPFCQRSCGNGSYQTAAGKRTDRKENRRSGEGTFRSSSDLCC